MIWIKMHCKKTKIKGTKTDANSWENSQSGDNITSRDSITLPEFWVWKLSESGPAEIARKVGNLPEFWVWKLPEIKASFFAAALKKQDIFSCYCKALSPICCSYKCCSACYIDSIQKLSLLQLLLKKIWPLPYTLPLLIPTCMQLHISVSHAAKQGGVAREGKIILEPKLCPLA